MHENDLSIKFYSNLSDEQRTRQFRSVKARTPNVGYRMMKGILQFISSGREWLHLLSSLRQCKSMAFY